MKPQSKQVLEHMLKHGFITHLRAEAAYGITRVAARIADLKKDGYEIDTEMITRVNRYGRPAQHAEYRLAPSKPDVMDAVHAEIEDAHTQGEMFAHRQEPW